MTDEEKTNHAFARSRSNAGLAVFLLQGENMKFEPFTIILHDDGETIEQAHVHPELTILTMSVNGVKEPARVIDTKYFLTIADAVNLAVTANV